MKIFWLNGRPMKNIGGIEKHTVDFVKALSGLKGVEVVLGVSRGSFVDRSLKEVKKHYLTFRSELSRDSLKLFKVLKEERPKFLVVNNGNEYFNAYLTAKALGIKLVLFRHIAKPQPYLIRKFVLKYASVIFAVSDFVREILIKEDGVEEEKVITLPNFVDEGEVSFKENPFKGKGVVLFCGKVVRGKGIYDYLKIYEDLKGKNLVFLVVGDGEELKTLREVYKGVHFVGKVENTLEYFSFSDLLIFPTYAKESFGRVIIEAFATKTLVLAYESGNTKFLIKNGVNGFLFKKGDYKSMEKIIKDYLKNTKRYEKIKENAYKFYKENFTKEKVLRKFIEVLSGIGP